MSVYYVDQKVLYIECKGKFYHFVISQIPY